MALGDRVRIARKQLKVSAREVDRRASLTRGHTNAIERGVYRSPQMDTVEALAGVLGVSIDWLMVKDDESGPLPTADVNATGTDS